MDLTDDRRQQARLLRLQDELRSSLESLRESRARLVAAGDAERRRIERNLHDGAQQHLVVVSHHINLALARLPDGEGTAAARASLVAAADGLRVAHGELRELARGIHPAALNDHGLPGALRALAERSPAPVRAVSVVDRRFPDAVEAALYYVVAEALTNAGRHARATSVTIEVAERDGCVTAEVADDGQGGADVHAGTGLRGLADRVEALAGRLEVLSGPGGTRIRASVPAS
jgi:signal transduction histidine kinase